MPPPLARHILHEGLRGLTATATFPVAGGIPMRSRYDEAYTRSLRDPEGFWAGVAEDVYWERRWDRVLDDARPPYYRWFAGGVLNTCYNALDLHIDRGRGKQRALVYDSPVTDTIKTFTYFELRDEV